MSQKMSDLIVSVDSDAERFSIICVKEKKEIFINDMEKEYSRYLSSLKDYSEGDLLESMICLPLTAENRVVGIISVQSPKKNAYTPLHLNMMKTLANYAGIALDNSDAYGRLQSVNALVESKNKNILDSIRYAQTIQKAFLPSEHRLREAFREHFVLYRPKDVVSGDFYWMCQPEKAGPLFVAVVDCTGHGVPGAFMSLIGNNALNLIVENKKITNPPEILKMLEVEVRHSLSRENDRNDDGMDICLCRVDHNAQSIVFAGAKRPLFVLDEQGKIQMYKGDKISIGGIQKSDEKQFSGQNVPYNKGWAYYLSTDGYVDQCDEKRQKIGTIRLHVALRESAALSLDEQKSYLENLLDEHSQGSEQRDDISMLAFRL
jgi:serine phosphatase RsbU (regulator of sigma subunit)